MVVQFRMHFWKKQKMTLIELTSRLYDEVAAGITVTPLTIFQ
jgi:hypothetical protein